MRILLLTLSLGLVACSSSPISQYCATKASCAMDDCELSAEACEELRQGEQNACEAELKATRDVIATGGDAACTTCVEAMDRYYNCAADIPTCTDFANAQTEDCDGEYQEYMEACTPQVQTACGQKSGEDTGDIKDTATTGTGTTGGTTTGVDVGALLYQINCQGCHGMSGEGGLGVALNDGLLASLSDDDIAGVIRDGIPPGMPGFSNQLNDEEITELIGFLRANFDN